MRDELFKLTVPPPAENCYTSNGYLKTKCRYNKKLADLQKVWLHLDSVILLVTLTRDC